jgi:hypothetical protein
MKEITLPIDLANALLQYLGTKPYQEVFQIIAALQKTATELESHQTVSAQ